MENNLFDIQFEGNALAIESKKPNTSEFATEKDKILIAYRPDKFNKKFDKFAVIELDEKKCYMKI